MNFCQMEQLKFVDELDSDKILTTPDDDNTNSLIKVDFTFPY